MTDNQDNLKSEGNQGRLEQGDLTLFPAWLGLRALASTPYKNSAYALSEVVDNSYGAGAKNIHVAVICKPNSDTPDFIAVLDDGKGMNKEELRRAIQYGNGEQVYTPSRKRKGLGRFGVGLLSATFNQCHTLNIWSWQGGIDDIDSGGSAQSVELDANTIQENKNNLLPNAESKPLPEYFYKAFSAFDGIHDNPQQGTLVVWRNLHKLTWKKADTLLKHLTFECGRIYRTFIAEKKLNIVLSAWSSDCQQILEPQTVGVVDPMFLKKWEHPYLRGLDFPMFMPYNEGVKGDDRANEAGDIFREECNVYDKDGISIGKYWIEASHRKIPDVVNKATAMGHTDPGKAPFGKLAHWLNGVSILREGRELALDPKWLPPDKTTSRWVSVSVNFEAKLDDVFGVDNSKQNALHLAALAGVPKEDMKDRAENDDVKECAQKIRDLINKMHSIVKQEREHTRSKKNNGKSLVSVSVNDGRLQQLGGFSADRAKSHPTESDNINPGDDRANLKKGYEGTVCDGEDGMDVLAENVRPDVVIKEKLKVDFVREHGNGAEFFNVRQRQGVIFIVLNQDHPFYQRLKDFCREGFEEDTEEELTLEERLTNAEEKLDNAMWVIDRLLYCYARAECEALGNDKDEFQHVRFLWGRIAKIVMREDDGQA